MSAGTLYTSSGSGNSYKVRLLAGILGIDLKHEEISLKVRSLLSPSNAPQSNDSTGFISTMLDFNCCRPTNKTRQST